MSSPELVTVGRILGVHGIKGWLKVYSDTEPREQIFRYRPWYLLTASGSSQIELAEGRLQGKGLVARFATITDRESAALLTGSEVAVPASVLPKSSEGTYYWRDLLGLRVINQHGQDLGVIVEMLETGANDVMRLQGDERSIDGRDRLLPWVLDEVVLEVNLADALLRVDWDADF